MLIELYKGDLLDVKADTVVLPVNGTAPGLEGNVARQLMRQVGVENMHEMYAPPPYYPFNGDCYWSSLEFFPGTHFNRICCLGFLSHEPEASAKGYMVSAFSRMLGEAGMDPDFGVTLACPVLTGGYRMNYVDAVSAMLEEINRAQGGATCITIAERDPEKFDTLQRIVRIEKESP